MTAPNGSRDLFDAIAASDPHRVETLLQWGADPDQVEDGYLGRSPLHVVIAELEHDLALAMVRLLLAPGVDIERTSLGLGGGTPLLCALFNGHDAMARFLLEAGADPNTPGGEGDTPLRWCAEDGNHDFARLLLARGASRTMDLPGGIEGRTALGMAVNRLDAVMVNLLRAAGANPDARDWDERRAVENLPSSSRGPRAARAAILRTLFGRTRRVGKT